MRQVPASTYQLQRETGLTLAQQQASKDGGPCTHLQPRIPPAHTLARCLAIPRPR